MTDMLNLLERAHFALTNPPVDEHPEMDRLLHELKMTIGSLRSRRNEIPAGAKILFLDIDGVLNDHRRHPNNYSPIMAEHVELLNALLKADPDIFIVLSSAWRTSFTTILAVESLLGCHGVFSKDRIIGICELDPELWHPNHEYANDREYWSVRGIQWRKGQIERFLEAHPGVHYVVLDDLPLGIDNLVQTDPGIGVTTEDMVRVMNLFAMQAIRDSGDANSQGRCIGCRAPSGQICGGCGTFINDGWDGQVKEIEHPDHLG